MRKFKTIDQAYFQERDRFAERHTDLSLWSIADNWPLFAGQVNIARSLAVYELVKRVTGLPGHICELGCWNGSNLVFLAKLVNLLNPHGNTEVIGFDSFEGLTSFTSEKDLESNGSKGRYKGNAEMLEEILRLYRLNEFVTLVKGDVQTTLPAFLQKRQDIRFSLVYIDLDLYAPTRLGVDMLYPRLLKGGIMVFDEYNMKDWPGETSAIHEILGDSVPIHSLPSTRQPTAYIVK